KTVILQDFLPGCVPEMRSNALRPRPKHTCPRHIGSGRAAALRDSHAGVPADTSVAVLAIGGFLRTSAAGLTIGGLHGRTLPRQAFPAGGHCQAGSRALRQVAMPDRTGRALQ
ncbi:hypothetical protein M5W90_15175, partial [Paenibacillus thiaminolyticus]|uniref:hypothetical protein n=1 Tax=Paenibacillus thiaminolyticus TaxID=49283 RepID=UPI002280F9BA